jgi:hypothetical protein
MRETRQLQEIAQNIRGWLQSWYILHLSIPTRDNGKEQRTPGRADFLCIDRPLHHNVRPNRTKTFHSKFTLSPTCFFPCIFLSAFHLHCVTADEISARNPQKCHASPFEQQQMTDRQLYSNISSMQCNSLGQSTWNPGITCQNSSGIPEINRNMRRVRKFGLWSVDLQCRNAIFYMTQQAAHHSKLDPSKSSRPIVRSPGGNHIGFRATVHFLFIFFNSGLWGYWHCGHSWPILPASGDSEDDCVEADGM